MLEHVLRTILTVVAYQKFPYKQANIVNLSNEA